MNNTGSFGAAIGGMTPELQAAISRRSGGNPSGAMGQVSNSAPTANPSTQNPPMQGTPSMPSSTSTMTSPTSESEIIIKALDSRLKSLSKVQEGGVVQ